MASVSMDAQFFFVVIFLKKRFGFKLGRKKCVPNVNAYVKFISLVKINFAFIA